MDDGLTKLVELHYAAGVATVTVGYAEDGGGIVGENSTRVQCAGQPSVEAGKLGLWLHYRWRPLTWLGVKRKQFF